MLTLVQYLVQIYQFKIQQIEYNQVQPNTTNSEQVVEGQLYDLTHHR